MYNHHEWLNIIGSRSRYSNEFIIRDIITMDLWVKLDKFWRKKRLVLFSKVIFAVSKVRHYIRLTVVRQWQCYSAAVCHKFRWKMMRISEVAPAKKHCRRRWKVIMSFPSHVWQLNIWSKAWDHNKISIQILNEVKISTITHHSVNKYVSM
jgi:hypothetical protein